MDGWVDGWMGWMWMVPTFGGGLRKTPDLGALLSAEATPGISSNPTRAPRTAPHGSAPTTWRCPAHGEIESRNRVDSQHAASKRGWGPERGWSCYYFGGKGVGE